MDIITPQFQYNSLKKPWFKKPAVYVLFLVLVIGLAGYFGLNYKLVKVFTFGKTNDRSLISKAAEDKYPLPDQNDGRFDVLILAIRGEDDIQNGGLLTDSIEVLSIDNKTKKASLISIPRDLFIDMGGVKGKINEAYAIGVEHHRGLGLVSEIVSRISGVYIDKTIIFDFNAFNEIITTMGGVDVHLDKPFSEKSQWGYEFALPAGDNHLNAEQALYYARSRYSSNDFDRARRQQEIMFAIKNKALSLGFIANPIKITQLFGSLQRNIKTNFQVWDINNLLDVGRTLTGSRSAIKASIISTDNVLRQLVDPKYGYILLSKTDDFQGVQNIFKHSLE